MEDESRIGWQLQGHTAQLLSDSVTGQLDLLQPMRGITELRCWEQAATDMQLLQLDLPELVGRLSPDQLAESYLRGNDLIVTYHPTPQTQTRTQVRWSAWQEPRLDCLGIDLLVSLQTTRMDLRPELGVSNHLNHGQWKVAADDAAEEFLPPEQIASLPKQISPLWCFLPAVATRLPCYFQIVSPADVVACRWLSSTSHPSTLSHRLLGDHLEKGVIRRVWMRCGWMPSPDMDKVRTVYHKYRSSAPPLTA